MNAQEGAPIAIRELDFEPPRWLRSPHVQSVVGSLALRRRAADAVSVGLRAASRPRVVHCSDGTRLEALVSRHEDAGAERAAGARPVVVIIHGWNGCGESLHVLSPAGHLFEAGWDVVRLHLRDHGGTERLNRELFHSCRIDETLDAVLRIREWFPQAPFAVVGFSLGGNFALRIGLRGPAAGLDLAGVVGVCPLLDPGETMAALDAGWFGYRIHFMRNWRRQLDGKRRAFPEHFDFDATRALSSITDMTRWFVEHYTPYESLDRYLAEYTMTGPALAPLAVPTRILAALDDPVIPAEGLDRLQATQALEVLATRYGGHCGFVADAQLGNWSDAALEGLLVPLTGRP